ncbi:GNAT family N-acetyltransferase [Streptobacillus felis]|uniref:GNAT family N-acetyltransferase n=1 Tax=Streptobacillus felis TaxID=1384509 RepID=A0A7Z0T9U0_9FUSO|nr:GNAT family N-acetyltransferase [Streptobacillus felis]NYV27350.1 GNAT family N-acetyltransferase [Streptobacillus felis]
MKISKVEYKNLYEFKDIKDSENNIYYAISFEHRIFGYLIIKKEEKLVIDKIYIKEDYRNSGYGSRLLNYAIYDCINLGYDQVAVYKHKKVDNFLEKNDFIKLNDIYVRSNLKEEIEELNSTIKVSKISIVINTILAALKLFLGYSFTINSLIADGINSFADLINNILILIGANIGKSPHDDDHPFGHGKVESVFSLIIGVTIIYTSLGVLQKGIMMLARKEFNIINDKFLIIVIISTILLLIKLIQYFYVYFVSKKYTNPLINALLVDYNVDIIMSSAVIVGILISKYISPNMDALLSIIISGYLLFQGYKILKENTLILMDSQDENLLLNVKILTLEVKEIENIHDIYMTRVGKNVYVIADIRVKSDITLERAHEISVIAEKKIKYRYSNIKKVIYHIEPTYSEE